MEIHSASIEDFEGWLALAAELEPLFGPMVNDLSFHQALVEAIREGRAWCVRENEGPPGAPLCGGIVVNGFRNEIDWFGVAERFRGRGLGRALLDHALARLDPCEEVTVRTFDRSSAQGKPARHLYRSFGFRDRQACGPTPTGFPTIIMARAATGRANRCKAGMGLFRKRLKRAPV
ncbi:MAG: N-acetyltransferase [Desulfomonilia bacterium]|jgi:ribosomal protein S18 acetylase RimI-like enzyme